MKPVEFIKIHAPWILIIVLITVQSSMERVTIPIIEFRWMDKLLHFLVFGILGWFLTRGMQLDGRRGLKKYYWISAIVVGCLFGALDEWHQSFVPGRYADVYDMLADCLGILTSVALYRWLKIRRVTEPVNPKLIRRK